MVKKVLLLLAISVAGGSIAAGNDAPVFDFTEPISGSYGNQLFSRHFNKEIDKAGSVEVWLKSQTYTKETFLPLVEQHEKALLKAKKDLIAPIIIENGLAGLPAVALSLAGAAFASAGHYKEGLAGVVIGALMSYVFYDFVYTAGDARENRQEYRDYKKSLDYLQQLKVLLAQS